MFKKNVSKVELIHSLKESIDKNAEALDYVQNEITRVSDRLEYVENDYVMEDTLKNLKYIEFTLQYLDSQYRKSLKQLGVRLWVIW